MRKKGIKSVSLAQVIYISVHIDPETLAEPGPCLLCRGDMDNVFLEYEFRDRPLVIKNSELVPGYRCRSCDAEYYDGSVALALRRETLAKLSPTSKLRKPLEESITRLTEALAGQIS